jgi:hypothetical protein
MPFPTSAARLEFVPVLRFDPLAFAPRSLPPPRPGQPEKWPAYWREVMDHAGLKSLQPLDAESWQVDAALLAQPAELAVALAVAQRVQGWTKDPSAPLDRAAGALTGGLAVRLDGVLGCEPACCSDLSARAEWALPVIQDDWAYPWNGHDGDKARFCKRSGGWIELELERADKPTTHWAVETSLWVDALAAADAQLLALEQRLAAALAADWGARAGELARLLAGLKRGVRHSH